LARPTRGLAGRARGLRGGGAGGELAGEALMAADGGGGAARGTALAGRLAGSRRGGGAGGDAGHRRSGGTPARCRRYAGGAFGGFALDAGGQAGLVARVRSLVRLGLLAVPGELFLLPGIGVRPLLGLAGDVLGGQTCLFGGLALGAGGVLGLGQRLLLGPGGAGTRPVGRIRGGTLGAFARWRGARCLRTYPHW
jgi:hypothetical protein